ncbi:type I restriction endonuclease subunit R [Treponema succinifaciens]|uniref:type I restriction endonuclease subunit R n=1 Tax=Treponema succinifaciens TaxID=167 RepID=UPI003FED6DFE
MTKSAHPERETQKRIVTFFQKELGYEYLGNLSEDQNYNIRWGDWKKFLYDSGFSVDFVDAIQTKFFQILSDFSQSSYHTNKEVYRILKYGLKLAEHPGESPKTVYFINWEEPEKNNFYIAEEVTVNGNVEKRPDIVLYINGIAVAVMELKKSTVSVADGIRQNVTNQREQFIQRFFSTVQICTAANDSEGLRYGTSGTTEKYYLEWKEDNFTDQLQDKDDLDKEIETACSKHLNLLEKQCYRIFQKERLLDIIHNFIIYDSGIKKVCRYNQFYAIKRCQKRLARNQGGIVWHTQGSGKSLTMVWLTKWILENITGARVLIITDREELDDQIEKIFTGVDLQIARSKSSDDLLNLLNNYDSRLMCSLIHKFGRRTGEVSDLDYEKYVEELKKTIPVGFSVKDKVFVFVDECHRTNSGKLHLAMKSIMPDSVFIGFTGTPLLKVDKEQKTTATLFGGFIHTYKFDQAVRDGVVLDLRYEARNVPQEISSKDKIDAWFEAKTKGLMPKAAAALKEKWATLQQLYSSKDRLEKIALDIIFDFETKQRLCDGRGNALLVAGSIAEACRYYEIFQEKNFKNCAIVSSYKPNRGELRTDFSSTTEDSENWKKQKAYLKMLGYDPDVSVGDDDFCKKIETFEKRVKDMFVDEPANMQLLIVVDKLLTGFDAPPCTYLYIDKPMHDHGLFQAICRVNRLDGDDKEFGYVVDYKELFGDLKDAVNSYTGNALSGFDEEDISGLLKNKLEEGKKRFEFLLQELETLTDDVEYPRDQLAFKHFFCGESGTVDPDNDDDFAKLRSKMYKLVSSLARAYADLKPAFDDVGYSKEEQEKYNRLVKEYVDLKDEIGLSSGDFIDLKQYDSAMRHLIDNYISASDSEKLGDMENFTLLAYIQKKQEEDLKNGNSGSDNKHKPAQQNVAETIENNIRRKIIEKTPVNPKYYQKMSELFQTLIDERKEEVASYKEMLEKYAGLVIQVENPEQNNSHPESIRTSLALCALYDNFGEDEEYALALHKAVLDTKQDHFRGDLIKERQIKGGIYRVVQKFMNEAERDEQMATVEKIYEIVKEQAEY